MHSGGGKSPSYTTPLASRPPLKAPGVLFRSVAASYTLRHFASTGCRAEARSFSGLVLLVHGVTHCIPAADAGRSAAAEPCGEHALA